MKINHVCSTFKETYLNDTYNMFGYAGKNNANNKDFQFWKQDYHPVELNSAGKLKERLDYQPAPT